MASTPAKQPARVVPFAPQPVREPQPFVLSPAALLMMASACLSAQAIADCLERDGQPVEREVRRHER